MARKYARIFALGHCLFREPNSFPRACELRGTDNVQGQISEHIFGINGSYSVYYPSNLFCNRLCLQCLGLQINIWKLNRNVSNFFLDCSVHPSHTWIRHQGNLSCTGICTSPRCSCTQRHCDTCSDFLCIRSYLKQKIVMFVQLNWIYFYDIGKSAAISWFCT